jgi:hypothetical protein
MSTNLKLTSKVIQISTNAIENNESTQTNMITTVLCEDGSIWIKRYGYNDWHCILEAVEDINN